MNESVNRQSGTGTQERFIPAFPAAMSPSYGLAASWGGDSSKRQQRRGAGIMLPHGTTIHAREGDSQCQVAPRAVDSRASSTRIADSIVGLLHRCRIEHDTE